MKKIPFLLIFLAISSCVAAQSKQDYDLAIGKFRKYYNQHRADSVFNLFSDRIKGMLPLEKTTEMINKLNEQLGELKAFSFTKQDEHFSYYKTEFAKGPMTLVAFLNSENKFLNFRFMQYAEDTVPAKKTGTEIVVKTSIGNIYGTLSVPESKNKMPVVLIIAGSGPTDRDGNNGDMKSYAYSMLADSLMKRGIACARYDKRGLGASIGSITREDQIIFEDAVNDGSAFVKLLKTDPRFSKVIVLGHSEGSLIGMIAAVREHADGYISLAGTAARIDKIIEKQLSVQSKETAAKITPVLDSLALGYTVKYIDPDLAFILRPSVLPYIMSWLKYDPAVEIKKLKVPVLILQGTNDIQVGTDEAELLKKALPSASLEMIKGMNHIMKQAPADRQQNYATYTDPSLPLSPGLVPAIVKLTNKAKA